jgi:hypothetical protein
MSAQGVVQPLEALGRDGRLRRLMEGLANAGADPKTVMIDATYLKAHRNALVEGAGERQTDVQSRSKIAVRPTSGVPL